MEQLKLYMVLAGCRPPGRHTEQHDMFFSIGNSLYDVAAALINWWPEAKGRMHIDAWREVTAVDGYDIRVQGRGNDGSRHESLQLYFINLGGYKIGEFEEYHYKLLTVGNNKATAIRKAKQTAFYMHTGFAGAVAHIDDKYGVDVDDIFNIEEALQTADKEKYRIIIAQAADAGRQDELHIGYLKLDKIKGL